MKTHSFKRLYFAAAAILLLVPITVRAEEVQLETTVVYRGTSTLHGFSGTAIGRPFLATLRRDAASGEIRASANASVAVLDMTTYNKTRDKKMYKMLKQDKFAVIAATLDNAILPMQGSREETIRLTICGVEHEVTATLSGYKREGDLITCQMAFDVSLKAFGLKPPSAAGLIRVRDIVNVECTIQTPIIVAAVNKEKP